MSKATKVQTGLCALIISATPAMADVTPQEVWNELQALYAGYGFAATASQTVAGNDLILSDIVMEPISIGDKNTKDEPIRIEPDYDLTLRDMGDGTVQIVMPEDFTIDMAEQLGGDGPAGTVKFWHQGLDIRVAGDVGDMAMVYTANSLNYLIRGLQDNPSEPETDITVEVSDISGTTKLDRSGVQRAASEMAAVGATVAVSSMKDGQSVLDLDLRYTDLAIETDVSLGDTSQIEDITALLLTGSAINNLSFSHQGLIANYSANDGVPISGDATSEDGSVSFAFTQDGMSLSQTNGRAVNNFSGTPGITPPITFEIGGMQFDMLAPLVKSETPKDFKALLELTDVNVSDSVWAMFDPTAELPRDPVALTLDVTGQANMLIDIFDMDGKFREPEPRFGPEGEIHALTLNALKLVFAGAELTGTGDFTFDNTDTESFDGMPRPEGALDVKLTGGNGLIDSLVRIGLIEEAQVTGARLMMAIFTNQVEGEDTMTSKLVVDENGSVFANGQQIK